MATALKQSLYKHGCWLSQKPLQGRPSCTSLTSIIKFIPQQQSYCRQWLSSTAEVPSDDDDDESSNSYNNDNSNNPNNRIQNNVSKDDGVLHSIQQHAPSPFSDVHVSHHSFKGKGDSTTYSTTNPKSSSHAYMSYDKSVATALVDDLLQHTRRMMDTGLFNNDGTSLNTVLSAKKESLPKQSRHHVVAFSGGVDSSLVAALLKECAHTGVSTINNNGDKSESVKIVLGLSPAVSDEQIERARSIAQEYLQLDLHTIHTNEGQDETYLANDGRACYACKTHLYSTLKAIALQQERENTTFSATTSFQLYNGTNADDLRDPTRLGLIAANEFSVNSPIDYISKDQVRLAARHLGLPNWKAAASPCLRSRLALGVPATQEHLRQIARAERLVRQTLNNSSSSNISSSEDNQNTENSAGLLQEHHNLRVRLLSQQRACIEIDAELLDLAQQIDWNDVFASARKKDNDHEWAFGQVLLRAFKSGSVAQNSTTL